MAIDFRIGTKILKNLQAALAPATAINPYPYVGVVKNNLDPTRCGRVQVFIPELGGNPDDQSNWRTVSYASPFMGYTSTEINSADIPDTTNGFGHVSHTYGMWMVPPDVGVEVICVFVAGDPMRGYWIACVNSNLSRYMLPGLGSSRNIDTLNATANTKASFTTGNSAPVVEFNENISANDVNPNFYNIPKPIHEIQYSILKQQGLNTDTTRGTITSSSQRETPSQVFGISTPGRPTNDPADDPNYVRDLNAGTITENYYRVKSRKGGHTFVMDDGSVLGVDQLVRLRTAGGHQVLMHDTEETIYVGHATGNSWIELSKTGSINIYSHGGVNLRSEGDINFHSDGNINLNADKNINLHAAKISNVASTYSLPDTLFNSNTGTWYSADNQIQSIATVAPTHEPFNRNTVANTSELSSSIFVDTNQLIQANLGMRGYVDSVADRSNYGNANVTAYLAGNVTVGNLTVTGNLTIYNNDGNIYIGDINTGQVNTDTGILFDGRQSIKSGVFTEVDGNILSYAINMAQITSNISAIAGGIFRLDVRNAYRKFVVVRRAAGATAEEETFDISLDTGLGRFTSNLQVGRTSTAYSNLTVAHTTPSTSTSTGALIVAGGAGIAGNLFVGGAVNNPTVTNYTESVVAIGTVTTASTLSLADGTVQTATLTASTACTFTMPTAVAGKSFILLLKQAAAVGSGTATFTGVKFNSVGAPTITAAAGKMDILSFISDGTNWYGSYTQGYTP